MGGGGSRQGQKEDDISQKFEELERVCMIHNKKNQCYAIAPAFAMIWHDELRQFIVESKDKNPTLSYFYNVIKHKNVGENFISKLVTSINQVFINQDQQWDSMEFTMGFLAHLDPTSNFVNMSLSVNRQCKQCPKTFSEPLSKVSILHLRLQLDEKYISLQQLLKRHMNENDTFPCTMCPSKLMDKTVVIHEAPSFLFVCTDRNLANGKKIATKIINPDIISLPLHNGEKVMYKLFGIILHIGMTSSSGHYVTYLYDDDSKSRYFFDDMGGGKPKFEEASQENFLNAKQSGYLYFYRQFLIQEDPPSSDQEASDDLHGLSEDLLLRKKRNLIRSSEIKRRQLKDDHCYFCREQIERLLFLEHLKTFRVCKTLYLRKFKTNNIEDVFLLSFECIACDIQKPKDQTLFQLKKHLQKNDSCLKVYCQHFQLHSLDIEELFKKIKNVKRKTFDSRSKKNLNQQYFKKVENKKKSLTITDALNHYKENIRFSNCYSCVICEANYLNSRVSDFTESEAELRNICFEEKKNLSSQKKLYICNDCEHQKIIAGSSLEESLSKFPIENVFLNYKDIGEKRVFFPVFSMGPDILEIDNDELIPSDKEVTILVPISLSCVSLSDKQDFQSDKALVKRISKCSPLVIDDLRRGYTNLWKKFQNAQNYASRYSAVETDKERKMLSQLHAIPDEKKIHLSLQWQQNTSNDMFQRFQNLGQKAVNITFKVLKSNIESFASSKVINGNHITCDYLGNSMGEMKTIYYLHNHTAEKTCSANCPKRNLQTLLDEGKYGSFEQYGSVFIASLFLKLRSFIEQILRNQNFGLYTENYFFSISFDEHANAFIHGCIWPQNLEHFNRILHDLSYGSDDDGSRSILYENFVCRNFSRSSDAGFLKQQFSMNDAEAKDLVEKVKTHQIDLNMDPYIPSLETFHSMVHEEVSNHNMEQAKDFMNHITEILLQLDEVQKRSLSTKSWLKDLAKNVEIIWNNFFDKVSIKLQTTQYDFFADSVLIKKVCQYSKDGCPFLGYFQYCRMILTEKDTFVVATEQIVEAFTYSFNPLILKAVECSTSVFPINGSFDWNLSHKENAIDLQNFGIEQSTLSSHKEVSLNELIYRIDTYKCRTFSNPPSSFVNTNPNKKQLYQKATEDTDNAFESDDSSGYYEPVFDNVARHMSRRNGEKLLLCETATHFDVLSNADSLKLIESLDIDKIPNSEIFSSITKTPFPEYIYCGTNQVLKLRKFRKILCYPFYQNGSNNWKYTRALLFYPHLPNEELTKDKVNSMISEESDIDKRFTVVDFNEKCFLDKKIKT